jgi:hypothetical protein
MAMAVAMLAAVSFVPSTPVFEFLPAAPLAAQAYNNASLNTWGGTVLMTRDSKYHLFMSAMGKRGSLNQWETVSEVAHAVASTPTGPFRLVQSAVLPIFHHNPAIVQAKDGTFLLYSIGQTKNGTHSVQDSSSAVFQIELHVASNINGPWRNLGVVINGSNPSPFVKKDGSIVVAFKGIPNGMRMATATHWSGPYRRLRINGSEILLNASSAGLKGIEDYDIWFDEKRSRWNCVLHQYIDNGASKTKLAPGRFVFSKSASLTSEWSFGPVAYNFSIALSDGSIFEPTHRERPKLLFDATTNEPSILFNGVATAAYGHTFTVAQRIKSFNPPGP